MEQSESNKENQQLLLDSTAERCQLISCSFHNFSFAIDSKGKVYSTDPLEPVEWKFPHEIVQIVPSCQQDSDNCRFYFRSLQNRVYEWNLNTLGERFKKRVKLNHGSAERTVQENFLTVAENIHYIMPTEKPGVVLFSENRVQYLNAENKFMADTLIYNAIDTTITCERFTNQLDTCLSSFFSIDSILYGLVFGTNDGCVCIRNLDKNPVQDTKIFKFKSSEEVKFIDLLSIPALSNKHNAIVAIGNQGTIMVYSKASSSLSEKNVSFNQFNIQGPILSVDQTDEKSKYLIASGSGSVSLLKLQFSNNDVVLESVVVTPVYNNVRKLKSTNAKNHIFDSICDYDGSIYYTSNCEYKTIEMTNDPEDIKQAIGQALAQLELSESAIKELDNEEQELSKKLASTNKTLYALQSINNKRKLGVINSLESTGFEFTIQPIIKPQSIANSSLHPSSFLRICIKTSRFLELEDWDLQLELFPARPSNTSNVAGETKIVSVVGFEPYFENGIERYSIWERDIELDLDCITLPLEVSATLMLTADEQEYPPLLFPISKTIVDDLHYFIPLSSGLISGIERRGLEEISNRLLDSFNKQKVLDKTGKYPFARLLNRKVISDEKNQPSKIFNYREVHIRCSVDIHMTNDSYRSILSTILNEGRTMDDTKDVLPNAEQAIFSLAAFPGCPIILKLSRVSSTVIDICVQCTYMPALFKTEAALLARLYNRFIQPQGSGSIDEEGQQSALLKKLKLLEDTILDIQNKYQNSKDQMDIDEGETMIDQLKKPIDILYSIHSEKPIGQLYIDFSEIH